MYPNRLVKIVILSVIVFSIIYGGVHLYSRFSYNKLAYQSDLYCKLIPDASHIVLLNKNWKKHYAVQDDTFALLMNKISEQIFYPAAIIYRGEDVVFLAKADYAQCGIIKGVLKQDMFADYSPRSSRCKDAKIEGYSVRDGEFLFVTFHQGLFVLSRSYNLIEEVIERDDDYVYLRDSADAAFIDRYVVGRSVSTLTKYGETPFVFEQDRSRGNDTLTIVNGYILSPDFSAYTLSSDSLFLSDMLGGDKIEAITVFEQKDENVFFEIELNKKY